MSAICLKLKLTIRLVIVSLKDSKLVCTNLSELIEIVQIQELKWIGIL